MWFEGSSVANGINDNNNNYDNDQEGADDIELFLIVMM